MADPVELSFSKVIKLYRNTCLQNPFKLADYKKPSRPRRRSRVNGDGFAVPSKGVLGHSPLKIVLGWFFYSYSPLYWVAE